MVQLLLRDRKPEMVEAWKKLHWPQGTDIAQGDVFGDVTGGAVVSPANSFGFMGGGLDKVLAEKWPGLEERVQKKILDDYDGELPVGQAFMVETGDREGWSSYVVVAPTMRVPGEIVAGSVNIYLAMRAVHLVVRRFNQESERVKLGSVLVTGLGTGVGAVPPDVAALQMCCGWKQGGEFPMRPGRDLNTIWKMHHLMRTRKQEES